MYDGFCSCFPSKSITRTCHYRSVQVQDEFPKNGIVNSAIVCTKLVFMVLQMPQTRHEKYVQFLIKYTNNINTGCSVYKIRRNSLHELNIRIEFALQCLIFEIKRQRQQQQKNSYAGHDANKIKLYNVRPNDMREFNDSHNIN